MSFARFDTAQIMAGSERGKDTTPHFSQVRAWPADPSVQGPPQIAQKPDRLFHVTSAVAANATEADARVGALLQENARLKREARIAAEERDSAVDSLERVTQKYNDLKRMRNIKRVTFVGEA